VLTHNNKEATQMISKVTQIRSKTTKTLNKFLDELKGLFNELLQHNSKILDRLTVVICKVS
jgi:ribosomal protein S17E